MSIPDGMFTGLVIGMIFSVPAMVYDLLFHKHRNLPLLVDVRSVWGRAVPARDVFPASIALHLFFATAFGGVYAALVTFAVLPSYAFRYILGYAVLFFFFSALVLLPLAGLGLFGRKEGALVWSELLLTHLLYACGLWYAATYVLLA
jgi:hypothetical protein